MFTPAGEFAGDKFVNSDSPARLAPSIWGGHPAISATAKWGRYLSRDLCLAWINALTVGDPDADIRL